MNTQTTERGPLLAFMHNLGKWSVRLFVAFLLLLIAILLITAVVNGGAA